MALRFYLGLFIFNPYGVVVGSICSPGFTWGYSYSTPTGLWPTSCFTHPRFHLFRQKFRSAKLLPERLFIFNPYGVVAHSLSHPRFHNITPSFIWGYSYATPTGLWPTPCPAHPRFHPCPYT